MALARFMASPLGRGGRVVIGLGLIGYGLGVAGGSLGLGLAVAGLLPLTLGLMNVCLLAPFLKVPLKGSDLPPA